MTITLKNDFHNTEITMRDKCGRLSKAQVRRAKKILCCNECKCSDEAGTRGPQYWQQADGAERQRVVISIAQDGSAEIMPYV